MGIQVKAVLAFFKDLKADNTRDWFQANKKRYEQVVLSPAKALADEVSAVLAARTDETVDPKIFRVHRDVRFSKDKTPYNTHLHILWKGTSRGAWFLGLAEDYFRAGFGVMDLKGEDLDNFRAAAATGAFRPAMSAITGASFGEPDLKRVPAPYGQDHAEADMLRRKSLTGWIDLDTTKDPLPAAIEAFDALSPLRAPLIAALNPK